MHDHTRFLKGTLFMTVSGFALSLMVLISRVLLEHLPLLPLVFFRFSIPTLLLLPVVLIQKRGQISAVLFLKGENIWKLLRSFFVVGAQLFILFYLTKGSLLNATVLLNTGPLFIPILERIFLKLPIGKSTAVAMFVSGLGVLLILHPNLTLFEKTSLIGLLAGLCQASSQVIFGHFAQEEKGAIPLFRLFYTCTLILIPVCATYFFAHFKEIRQHLTNLVWILLAAVAFSAILNQFCRSKAYFFGKPSTLACFLYISIIFSAFFDWLFFHQKPDLLAYIGAALVIIGGILKIYLRYIILKRKGL